MTKEAVMSNTVEIGAVRGAPLLLLRIEGLAVLAGAVIAYHSVGASWWHFAVLFFVPDVTMLGYLRGRSLGAAVYNVGHTYATPAALLAFTVWSGHPLGQAIGLTWIAHIGFDRMAGYGLKYAASFSATHLGRMGPQISLSLRDNAEWPRFR
jgi:hypothetical protein